eukprot:351398-Chlamydomonas_euryale.AAC.1
MTSSMRGRTLRWVWNLVAATAPGNSPVAHARVVSVGWQLWRSSSAVSCAMQPHFRPKLLPTPAAHT